MKSKKTLFIYCSNLKIPAPQFFSHLMNSYLLHPAFLHRVPRKWPEISIFIRRERTYLTSSSSSPGTSGKTWAQRQKEPRGIRDNDCGNKANESVHHSSVSQPNLYRSLLIPRGLRVQYGGLADGFTDGPGLKRRTRCLSITMLVPFVPFSH